MADGFDYDDDMDTPEFGTSGYQASNLTDAVHARKDALQHDLSTTKEEMEESDDEFGEDSFISHPEDEGGPAGRYGQPQQNASVSNHYPQPDRRNSDSVGRPSSALQQQPQQQAGADRPPSAYGQQRGGSASGDRPGSTFGQGRVSGDRPGSAFGQQQAARVSGDRPSSAYRSTAGAASQQAQPPMRTTSLDAERAQRSAGMGEVETGRSDDDEEVSGEEGASKGGYRAADHASLPVSKDLRDLFQYITRFQPQQLQLDTPLKPFIPDYIPAIGDIDEFIKVPRPDGRPDYLGLKVLDEPAARQTDPSVLSLQLRQSSKRTAKAAAADESVSKVEDAAKNGKRVDEWIQSIAALHKSKPPSSVSYSRNMPDIEPLMEQWPEEMESLLHKIQLPDASLDMDLKTFATMVCTILDIPVYTNVVESLHVLFTLFLEFKHNPAFLPQPIQAMQPGFVPQIASPVMSHASISSSGMGTPGYANAGANIMTF